MVSIIVLIGIIFVSSNMRKNIFHHSEIKLIKYEHTAKATARIATNRPIDTSSGTNTDAFCWPLKNTYQYPHNKKHNQKRKSATVSTKRIREWKRSEQLRMGL